MKLVKEHRSNAFFKNSGDTIYYSTFLYGNLHNNLAKIKPTNDGRYRYWILPANDITGKPIPNWNIKGNNEGVCDNLIDVYKILIHNWNSADKEGYTIDNKVSHILGVPEQDFDLLSSEDQSYLTLTILNGVK